MAAENFMFNCAKGKSVEWFARVAANDPTNSQIILVPLATAGTEAQGQDLDTLAAIEADANFSEQTTSWTRKNGRDTGGDFVISAPTVDDTNNRFPAAIPAVTWTGPTTGNNTAALLVCYDSDSTGGTDSNVIPISQHIFAVTADGNDVVVNAGDVVRAA